MPSNAAVRTEVWMTDFGVGAVMNRRGCGRVSWYRMTDSIRAQRIW
jgi:hypothetical protein